MAIKLMKRISMAVLLIACVTLCAMAAVRYFLPDLYSGFRQGVLRLPAVAGTYQALVASGQTGSGDNITAALVSDGDAADQLSKLADLTQEEEMRGVWIASVYSIDFPKTQNNIGAQKQELITILETVREAGLNTVYFQVRPHGDALYPSEIFPWSSYLTGTAGQDPGYDPLAFLLEEADRRGIRVHAWINPYRLTMGTKASPQNTHAFLPEGSPVKNRPDLTMAAGDGKLYLNPGEPEAMALVVAGVQEIIEHYNVDGIHFDDYFYPYDPEYDDGVAYEKYGKPQGLSLEDWRRENTFTLMKQVHDMIQAVKPGVEFGISPSGIWRNAKNDPAGSATNGYESYSQSYADSRRWVEEEIIDYIVPQIYWAIGTENSDYAVLVPWWQDICLGTRVKLYIGHAAYRVGNDGPWQKPTEIGSQVTLNRMLDTIDGSVFYGYSKIAENALGLKEQLADLFLDTALAQPLAIAYPADGFSITAENTYMIGSADPRFPVYLNGQQVARTVSGYFSVYVPLEVGANKLVFSYRGEEVEYTITRNKGAASGSGGTGSSSAGQGPAITYLEQPLVYVTKDDQTVVRAGASASATRLQPLKKGVKGLVVAESNGYYLMSSGNWTYKPNVTILEGETLASAGVSQGRLAESAAGVELIFQLPYFVSYYVDVTDEATILTLHGTKGQALEQIGGDALFGQASFVQDGSHAVYTLPHKELGRLYGYTIAYDEAKGQLTFCFRHPLTLAAGDLPLAGKTILLDAGHGGSDRGAQGPAGTRGKAEKDINLELALVLQQVLEEAGAQVVMTREDDVYFELTARADLIRQVKPDLAISLHRNSMGADKDISQYKGVLALYSHQQSAALAQYLSAALVEGTNHYYDGIRWQSLAMCRIEECPAVLLELGFISNPGDYERMNRFSVIQKEAKGILTGIVNYLADA